MPVEDATDAEIIAALEKLVSDGVEAGTFVILEGDPSRNYYVQFALHGGAIWCEAVSNEYLEPEHRLSEPQTERLQALGWHEAEHEGPNWFRTFTPRLDAYVAIVERAREAFTEVYGLPADTPLRMSTSWDVPAVTDEPRVDDEGRPIFICYRQGDSAGFAGRLHDSLQARFTEQAIFMDINQVPGMDFRDAIDEALRSCRVVLAVIGPNWLRIAGRDGRPRLSDPRDFVRLELEAALRRDGLPVIPVLVDDASVPAPDDLPPSLQALSYRYAATLRHRNWRPDVEELSKAIAQHLE